MKTPVIWKKMVIDGRRVVTSAEIREMAQILDKDEWRSLDYLQKQGYIDRILKGIFYVRSPEERERGFTQFSVYDMVAKALKTKGVKQWYFGLETALKFNNMTHEYFAINYVITGSYRTTKVIGILDTKFQFHKWKESHFKFGLVRKGGLRYSDPEKTVLDLAYRRHRKTKDSRYVAEPIVEYAEMLDRDKLEEYLGRYSLRFRNVVRIRL